MIPVTCHLQQNETNKAQRTHCHKGTANPTGIKLPFLQQV